MSLDLKDINKKLEKFIKLEMEAMELKNKFQDNKEARINAVKDLDNAIGKAINPCDNCEEQENCDTKEINSVEYILDLINKVLGGDKNE